MKVQNGEHERRKLVTNDTLEPKASQFRVIEAHVAMTLKQALYLKRIDVEEAVVRQIYQVEDISLLS